MRQVLAVGPSVGEGRERLFLLRSQSPHEHLLCHLGLELGPGRLSPRPLRVQAIQPPYGLLTALEVYSWW